MGETREGWQNIVTPDDLDAHMLEIGQVQANGTLINQLFLESKLPRTSRVYVPGAGTGQIFDFIEFDWSGYDFLFTDLRSDFLVKIETRLPAATYFRIAVDDVEDSKIDSYVDVAVIVLVLEHVNWRKALREVMKARPRQLFIVIQRNEVKGSSVVAKRKLRPSILKFANVAKSELVDAKTLTSELSLLGFRLQSSHQRGVPDNKTMIALRYVR